VPRKNARKKRAPATPRRRLTGWKAWALKIGLALASPVLFLLLLEGILWVAGTGTPTDFLVPWQAGETQVHITNRDFCLQFVPQALSRAPMEAVLRPKADGAVRIVVLGGSAAAGDPDSDSGFCRLLEILLNDGASGHPVEIVNGAITAMNSHVARRVALGCAGHGVDAFIIYMGNNEIVGPYGPHSLPSFLYKSASILRGLMAARRSRVGQLVTSLFQSGGPTPRWEGMEAFLQTKLPLGDSRLEDCTKHFEANLRDIIATALDAGAEAIVCVVPTNVRSCAPFGAAHRDGLSSDELDAWGRLFDEGRKLQRAGSFKEALAKYQQASEIDDGHATLVYCMATCAEKAGEPTTAAPLYRRALDLDTLRFRADSRINAIIRQSAADTDATLLDLERTLEAHAESGLIGDNLLVDHVHLNFRANVLAALAAAKILGDVLPQLSLNVPASPEEAVAKLRGRVLYDARAEYDVALTMYQRKARPPFVAQLDHPASLAKERTRLVALKKALRLRNRPRTEDEHVAAVREAPQDPLVLRRLGDLLIRDGRAKEAIRLYRERLGASPYCTTTLEALATALVFDGQYDEGVEALTRPSNPYALPLETALPHLGTTLIQCGMAMESEKLFQRLVEVNPKSVEGLTNLGAAASGKGKPDEAAEILKRALAVDARSVDAMVNLANTYVKRNRRAEALEWFQKAVDLDAYHATAQLGLGLELTRHGESAEGLEHMKRSVELNPAFAIGYRLLSAFHKSRGAHALARENAALASLFQSN